MRADRVPAFHDLDTGISYFNVSALRPSAVDGKFVHEVLAHQGIREVLGPERAQQFYLDVYRSFAEDPEMAEVLKKYGIVRSDAYGDPVTDEMTDAQRAEAADEFAAAIGEEALKPDAERAPWYRRALFKIREILRKFFPKLRVSLRDIETLLREAAHRLRRQRAEVARGGQGEGVRMDLFDNPEKRTRVIGALQKIADGADEVTVNGLRNDLEQYGGTNDISFVWGNPKKGFYHIVEAKKRGLDTLFHVIDAVSDGQILRYVEGNKTVILEKDGYEAVLALTEFGKRKSWLLSGWKVNEPDATGEVSTQSDATQPEPTFSRQELGAGLKDIIARFGENSSGIRKAIEDDDAPLVEPKPFDPAAVDYEDADQRAVQVLMARYATAAEFDDEEVADYLRGAGFYDITAAQAHKLTVRAREEYRQHRQAEIVRNNARRRDDWLYENNLLWKQAVDYAGSENFKVRVSERMNDRELSGTAPCFLIALTLTNALMQGILYSTSLSAGRGWNIRAGAMRVIGGDNHKETVKCFVRNAARNFPKMRCFVRPAAIGPLRRSSRFSR